MTETLRVVRRHRPHADLHGYVFTDLAHAREWLCQSFVADMQMMLEPVDVGPLMPCPRCNGQGWRQDIKVTGPKMTVGEFLADV